MFLFGIDYTLLKVHISRTARVVLKKTEQTTNLIDLEKRRYGSHLLAKLVYQIDLACL